MNTALKSLLNDLLSFPKERLPAEREATVVFNDNLLGAFLLENPNIKESEVGKALDESFTNSIDQLLRDYQREIFDHRQTARKVLSDFSRDAKSSVELAAIISLAVNAAYGHGRRICDVHNVALLKKYLLPQRYLLDIGSGNCWIGKTLREKGIRMRCFDSREYSNYWLHMWDEPDPGWPSSELETAIQDENAVPYFSFPHREHSHPAEIVGKMKGNMVIIFPGPDIPNPETNDALKVGLFRALRRRSFFVETNLPDSYKETARFMRSRPPLIFVQDAVARQIGK
jgi:hypothetical protein